MLADALAAESEKRWSDSLTLCREFVENSPLHPDALNLMGRLHRRLGDAATAIALQTVVLRLSPRHARAAHDLALARSVIYSREDADRLYDRAIALEPDVANHYRPFGAVQLFVGIDRVEALIRAALSLDPSHAMAHAALGNILARRGNREAAKTAYSLANSLDWDYADAHIALSEFYDAEKNAAFAAQHLLEALSRKTYYTMRGSYAVQRILVLKAPGTFPSNAQIDFCIDRNRADLDVLYVTPHVHALPDLSMTDVVFSAIGETEANAGAIEQAIGLLESCRRSVINHPSRLERIRRSNLASTLHQVPDCIVPPTKRLGGDECLVEPLEYPAIIRPIDTHRGDGMEIVSSFEGLTAHLKRYPAAAYNVMPFVDYRSSDGLYRKYRVIVVDGVPFPYHLAISNHWLVHYWRVADLMAADEQKRTEEERFLRDPASAFPTWSSTFRMMAEAIGLDYFGVDCAVTSRGEVLVFECDPSAFVHCSDGIGSVFDYKYEYVPRIFDALQVLFERKMQTHR